ncbi:hypothetical protein OC844_007575, partial [Tilletia horrida]
MERDKSIGFECDAVLQSVVFLGHDPTFGIARGLSYQLRGMIGIMALRQPKLLNSKNARPAEKLFPTSSAGITTRCISSSAHSKAARRSRQVPSVAWLQIHGIHELFLRRSQVHFAQSLPTLSQVLGVNVKDEAALQAFVRQIRFADWRNSLRVSKKTPPPKLQTDLVPKSIGTEELIQQIEEEWDASRAPTGSGRARAFVQVRPPPQPATPQEVQEVVAAGRHILREFAKANATVVTLTDEPPDTQVPSFSTLPESNANMAAELERLLRSMTQGAKKHRRRDADVDAMLLDDEQDKDDDGTGSGSSLSSGSSLASLSSLDAEEIEDEDTPGVAGAVQEAGGPVPHTLSELYSAHVYALYWAKREKQTTGHLALRSGDARFEHIPLLLAGRGGPGRDGKPARGILADFRPQNSNLTLTTKSTNLMEGAGNEKKTAVQRGVYIRALEKLFQPSSTEWPLLRERDVIQEPDARIDNVPRWQSAA